jgi:hypothetical protein
MNELATLFEEKTAADSVIRLARWPEGYLLWFHGRIVWREWSAAEGQENPQQEIERLKIEVLNYQLQLTDARKIIRPFAERSGYGNGKIAEAAKAAATFLNKIGWGKP